MQYTLNCSHISSVSFIQHLGKQKTLFENFSTLLYLVLFQGYPTKHVIHPWMFSWIISNLVWNALLPRVPLFLAINILVPNVAKGNCIMFYFFVWVINILFVDRQRKWMCFNIIQNVYYFFMLLFTIIIHFFKQIFN